MKKNKLFYLGLAAVLALLITATALYAEPMVPIPGGGGDEITLRGGNGGGSGSGQRNRNRNRRGNRGRRGGRSGGNRYGRCFFAPGILDLSSEQKEEIKGIYEDHKATLTGLRESLQEARWEFRALNWADEADPNEIREAAEEMAGIRADIMVEMSEIKSEIRDLLTDEQLGKLEEMKDRRIGFLEKAHDRLGRCLDYFE